MTITGDMTDHAHKALSVPHPFADGEWFVRNTWTLLLAGCLAFWGLVAALIVLV